MTSSQGHRNRFVSATITSPFDNGAGSSNMLHEEGASNINDKTSIQMTSDQLRVIKLPPKTNPIGRPKGSINTAIGRKRKPISNNSDFNKKQVKFFDRSSTNQGALIAKWFTNWPEERIQKKKITMSDIIQDDIIFGRLTDKGVKFDCAKSFFDRKAFKYLEAEIDRIRVKKRICPKCRKFLSGLQVLCQGCLDWYHSTCIKKTAKEAAAAPFFCETC